MKEVMEEHTHPTETAGPKQEGKELQNTPTESPSVVEVLVAGFHLDT